MDRFYVASQKAMKTPCFCNGEKHIVRDFMNDDSLIFIAFYYTEEELETYYKIPYIQMCMDSWIKQYPKAKILYIQMLPLISEFSDATYYFGKRNYPTDSQRVLYSALLPRTLYLDVDVFLPEKLKEIEVDDYERVCTINHCSGTGLYSNRAYQLALQNLYLWYEEKAVNIIRKNLREGVPIERGVSDVEAIAANGYFPNVDLYIDHFSYAYPIFRDKKTFRIIDSPESDIIFHKASKEAFLEYIKYRKYDKYLKEDGEVPIAFV